MASQLAHSLETALNVALDRYNDLQKKHTVKAVVDEEHGSVTLYGDLPKWIHCADYVQYIQSTFDSPTSEVVVGLDDVNGMNRHVQAVCRKIETQREQRRKRRGRF